MARGLPKKYMSVVKLGSWQTSTDSFLAWISDDIEIFYFWEIKMARGLPKKGMSMYRLEDGYKWLLGHASDY